MPRTALKAKSSELPARPRKRARHCRHGIVRVGTASWSDPGFVKDWYPPGLPARERLAWYAEHFQLVEVNSTFYAVPAPEVVARWADQTPRDFVFDVKLHRLLSRHSTAVQFLPPDLRALAEVHGGKTELTPKLEEALAKRFLEGIEPLDEAGKLGALLLQLTPSFRPRANALAELDQLMDLLSSRPLAVELRHREWLDDAHRAETVAYFDRRGVTLVSVDAPRSEHFMVVPDVDFITNVNLAYLRAHGRNSRGFISGRTVAERFDYQYSDAEIADIATRSETLANLASETHVIFNNNKSNYAPLAAARLTKRLAATSAAGD